MSRPNQSFLDSRTIAAMALTAVAWIGWQWYMQKKYPPVSPATVEASAPNQSSDKVGSTQGGAPSANTKRDELGSNAASSPETTLTVETDLWVLKLSSHGMGIRDFQLKGYKDRNGEAIRVGGEVNGRLPLETNFIGRLEPLNFTIEKISPEKYVGRAVIDGVEIVKTLDIVPSEYRIDSQVAVKGSNGQFTGLVTYLTEPIHHTEGGGMFSPALERQELFVLGSEANERILFDKETENNKVFEKTNVLAVGTQYFTQAIVDRSDIMPESRLALSAKAGTAQVGLTYNRLNQSDQFFIKYTAFLGPKSLEILKGIDENLAAVVDFGFFSALGRPILGVLKWFHKVIGNWGVAIILLTFLVRLLVLPFNVMSFRSMKAMQVIQPQIKALREKYQSDPNRLNQEMMVLFKTNKVNPLGGCLPMLLQLPPFLALYQVLGHSIELYQAPFAFWIHDLSLKDPFFVLPVLMGATMFFQQRITPSTLDPVQAKMMMFMPIIFSFFMLALPSGLTLYMLISALFGIGQQMYLMNNKNPSLVTSK